MVPLNWSDTVCAVYMSTYGPKHWTIVQPYLKKVEPYFKKFEDKFVNVHPRYARIIFRHNFLDVIYKHGGPYAAIFAYLIYWSTYLQGARMELTAMVGYSITVLLKTYWVSLATQLAKLIMPL